MLINIALRKVREAQEETYLDRQRERDIKKCLKDVRVNNINFDVRLNSGWDSRLQLLNRIQLAVANLINVLRSFITYGLIVIITRHKYLVLF